MDFVPGTDIINETPFSRLLAGCFAASLCCSAAVFALVYTQDQLEGRLSLETNYLLRADFHEKNCIFVIFHWRRRRRRSHGQRVLPLDPEEDSAQFSHHTFLD